MPKQYEAMRDKFAKTMDYDKAQAKAAAIYNSRHPGAPVTGNQKFAEGGPVMANKGYMGKTEQFAQGGPVNGTVSKFWKLPNEFTDCDEGDAKADKDQLYAKSGEGAGKGYGLNPPCKDKSEKPVKPRK